MNAPAASIERELTSPELGAVGSLLGAVGLPANAWTAVPGLADLLENVAVARRLERLQRERPVSYRLALRGACAPLGVKPAAFAKRLVRWSARWWPDCRAREETVCPREPRTFASSPTTR